MRRSVQTTLFTLLLAAVHVDAAEPCRLQSLPTSGSAVVHAIAQGEIGQLVACGFPVNKPIQIDGEPMTPLAFAASLGDPRIVEQVIGAGADPNFGGEGEVVLYPLEIALSSKKYAAAEVLIKHGAHADYRLPGTGMTALMAIAFDGGPVDPRNDILPVLLARGASIGISDSKGNTALHWAARAGNSGYAERLLAKGADACAINLKQQRAADVVPASQRALKARLTDACPTLPTSARSGSKP
jgi:ankyrin repeat protein